ncbi:MAG TPA: YbhB/YbcL family Raf kinase inhibitor-like protein [bacterium]|nr:YbhB/YbcL family Raf kinase inhibitor-like protein [bacterium]
MAFSITSPAFQEGEGVPKKHTCDGEDLSPPLQWGGAPAGTKAFALILDDPDAPPGTWVHWVVYDIPASAKGLTEGVPKKETLPDGSKQGLAWGVESFSRVGYSGPCPPPGKPHRYDFKLYALDAMLGIPPKSTKFDVEKAMKGHVLAEARLMGKFGR